ncbi:MAG: OmpA family protein [Chitinophagaceae bacterium]|nr:OmpA family protein [Bacteroidota bacterium]MCC6257926.1 OmpA family protein [Chitinophagaceae bacterium]MCW5917137.1 OmpA family protein [Ferruginibacter sp.]
MKLKFGLLFFGVLMASGLYAQSDLKSAPEKKGELFGIHFNGLDFLTPQVWRNTSSTRKTAKIKDLDYGLGLSYWKGLSSRIDFTARVNGIVHNYSAEDRSVATTKTEFGIELEPSIVAKALKDNNFFNPFLSVGIGGGYYTGKFGAYVPTGVGVQVNFNSVTYLLVQAQYRWTLTEKYLKDNLMYSVGVAQNFGPEKPKVVPPPPPPPVLDRDGDGVNDVDDKCPDVPGLKSLQGCPDKDGDGIADADDKCPDVAGVAKYQGCPIPDTDGDGINDEEDKCPNVKGVARYQGCPVPDTDGDGVNDEEDKCPNRPGPASNQGCPEISKEVIQKVNYAAKNVFFASGSFKLLPKSFKSLDEVVKLMKEDDLLRLQIDGHTDSQGNKEKNQTLSENRAKAVMDYLVGKGIPDSRIKSAGYGDSKPIADNKTAAGRAKNRRVEISVSNF